VNFVENCKIYSKELLVNEVSGIINSDKFNKVGLRIVHDT